MELFMGLFFLVFFLSLGTILVSLFRDIRQWNKNNHSPRLTVDAQVVAKRQDFRSRRRSSTGNMHYAHATLYYITFQVESGDRMELSMDGSQFGMLVEGDRGKLTFQGTRFLDFARM